MNRITPIKEILKKKNLRVFAHTQKKLKDGHIRLKLHLMGEGPENVEYAVLSLRALFEIKRYEWIREEEHYIGSIKVPEAFILILIIKD